MRDLDGLDESHLDLLIRAERNSGGWIPPAIAKIGTPRALGHLADRLSEGADLESQLGTALQISAPAMSIVLAERVRDSPLGASGFIDAVCQVYSREAERSAQAASLLLNLAQDDALPTEKRAQAIKLLGCLGVAAREFQEALQQLRDQEPRLVRVAEAALYELGEIERIVKKIESVPTEATLRRTAEFRQVARQAGHAVVPLVRSNDWELRLAAIKTLGYLAHRESAPALIELLDVKEDWRVPFAAAESLGRLTAEEAVGPLEHIAQSHWYPPVRASAGKAIRVIRGNDRYCQFWHPRNFAIEFLSVGSPADLPERGPLPRLSPGRGELGWLDLKLAGAGEFEPELGLSALGGRLLGTDHGEWGGSLKFVDADGKVHALLEKNTTGIHRLGDNVIAVIRVAAGYDAPCWSLQWYRMSGIPEKRAAKASRIAASASKVP